jgi:hypothetical protein
MTNSTAPALSRYELIVLAQLVTIRADEVNSAINQTVVDEMSARPGSDDARRLQAKRSADLSYRADLQALWQKLDAAVESTPA